jgi:hypothetical protein
MRRRGIGRAGRPSLVGTAARTAVIAGTATAVSGSVAASQQAKAQQAAAAAAPPPAAPPPPPEPPAAGTLSDDAIARLRQLAELKEQGILTDAEFEEQKARLLG